MGRKVEEEEVQRKARTEGRAGSPQGGADQAATKEAQSTCPSSAQDAKGGQGTSLLQASLRLQTVPPAGPQMRRGC